MSADIRPTWVPRTDVTQPFRREMLTGCDSTASAIVEIRCSARDRRIAVDGQNWECRQKWVLQERHEVRD